MYSFTKERELEKTFACCQAHWISRWRQSQKADVWDREIEQNNKTCAVLYYVAEGDEYSNL
jgi:hypothetical protein